MGGGVPNSGREQAYEAVAKAAKVVNLLRPAFELLVEDDPVQPAVKHLNAALYEAEARLSVLEDWCRRTYEPNEGANKETK